MYTKYQYARARIWYFQSDRTIRWIIIRLNNVHAIGWLVCLSWGAGRRQETFASSPTTSSQHLKHMARIAHTSLSKFSISLGCGGGTRARMAFSSGKYVFVFCVCMYISNANETRLLFCIERRCDVNASTAAQRQWCDAIRGQHLHAAVTFLHCLCVCVCVCLIYHAKPTLPKKMQSILQSNQINLCPKHAPPEQMRIMAAMAGWFADLAIYRRTARSRSWWMRKGDKRRG